ncbi:MAG: hypothetical protein A3A58_01575 [Candidatus Blackburnbacteria bacterium RIFCSPLOWO2_01_FULL_41_27]|uniref:Uncharacterized protein n=2 Tax=Candidatus Blackburniibacteriota TaxID=1817898 RepID=A0A1G1V5L5_9BACT|nr:MAG: hypothetical protein A3F61_02280 [Candidatus Blackburnbacteria bacterium RIFCSPHIGHO2_12_FULL_41_13b]OGY14337.1 MAG: hypothetical protein A3A58_01575 [Candidatus Blackburnbacteria bacterium RIFCSPLOWO2_01_FULL_41_27]
MSDFLPNLGSRWKVFYGAENRQKRLWRDTAVQPTVTDTVNAVYSALQNLFDELTQMDDGAVISAQTPTEYTIGIIESGDKDPWFVDRTSVEYLTAGALKTASWARAEGTNVGILKLSVTSNTIVAGDIGLDITHGDGDVGTLLDLKDEGGSNATLWIRPDTSATANSFDATGTLTCNSNTATFTYDVTPPGVTWATGESLWANIYTLGTIESNTHMYIYQNAANLVAYKAVTDWWGDGHIDILVNVKESSLETDEAAITVFARQYSKTYSYYIVDLTNGGRNPIPLQTGNDLDNQSGYWQMDLITSSGTFVDGEEIKDDSDATIRGIVTSWNGTDKIIEYYLIGDPQTNFGAGTGGFSGLTSTATGTAVAPTAVGPSNLTTPPTIVHGGLATGGSYDVNEDGTAENYSIVIDCNQHTLGDVYQFTKYNTRRSETGTATTDGLQGQFYIGSDYKLEYASLTGTVSDGAVVTQLVSGATGTVVNHNTTDKILILRNSRGTFAADGSAGSKNVRVDASNYVVMDTGAGVTATPITPIASAPFGTFAGGKFFCAPGVVLADYLTADLNNFQLVDDNGTVRVAPTKVNIIVSNIEVNDRIAVFRLTPAGAGQDIKKDSYTTVASQSPGATTLQLSASLAIDEPGKSTGGSFRLIDTSANIEYRLRFTSWATDTITLSSTTGLTADAGTGATTIVDAGVDFTSVAKVGDLIRNTTAGGIGYITVINSATNVTTTSIAGQTTGDAYQINTLPITTAADDNVYIPFIDDHITTAEASDDQISVQVVYSASVPVRVRARNAGQIIPFEAPNTISSTGMSQGVVRNLDSIFQ